MTFQKYTLPLTHLKILKKKNLLNKAGTSGGFLTKGNGWEHQCSKKFDMLKVHWNSCRQQICDTSRRHTVD